MTYLLLQKLRSCTLPTYLHLHHILPRRLRGKISTYLKYCNYLVIYYCGTCSFWGMYITHLLASACLDGFGVRVQQYAEFPHHVLCVYIAQFALSLRPVWTPLRQDHSTACMRGRMHTHEPQLPGVEPAADSVLKKQQGH